MFTIAKIAVENALPAFDKEYSYLVPERMVDAARAGCRVLVPFGGGNKRRTGLVLSLHTARERDTRWKPIAQVLDTEPVLGAEGIRLVRYLREFTFCTWFDAFRALIPAGLGLRPTESYALTGKAGVELSFAQSAIVVHLNAKKQPVDSAGLCAALGIAPGDANLAALVESGIVEKIEGLRRRVRDEKITMVRLAADPPPLSLTKRQEKAVEFLGEHGEVSLKELTYYLAMTKAIPDTLVRKGVLEYFDMPRLRNPYDEAGGGSLTDAHKLSPEQDDAFLELKNLAEKPKPGIVLLYGVTGSGKTPVVLTLIETVVAKGKGVVVLVPEISLTGQMVWEFHRRFGKRVAVLHSGLSLGERLDEWRRIKDGGADIVVGTRSAVFAPLENIGLIVLDEEQEHTYHSEKSPRYHARDVAKFRCEHHGAMLLLASATPSVESYHFAREGAYPLITLNKRYGDALLPDVYTVDMGDSENASASPLFSQRLLDELHYNLTHGEQSILLLNRRGHSTLIRCTSCGAVEECPHCSVSMTYHNANDALVCHYCGFAKRRPKACAVCGSELVRFSGYGTQRLQEELAGLYPSARILRVDMDTTLSKFSHERLFQSFLSGDYDIMIGTQMVAKGLNFPDVTLVGVLAADQALYAMDFRSFEKSFALLTQVVGRSGRGEKRGRAIIQTYVPEHPVISLAAMQDYPGFFAQEILSRKHHLYPPYCTLAGIGFVGASRAEVTRWSEWFVDAFKQEAEAFPRLPIRVLGPVDADTYKAAGKYRRKLIIKCRNSKETRALFRAALERFYRECKTVTIFVDMHYDRI